MRHKPIKSVVGRDERHKCRRCWRTLPHHQFKPIVRDAGYRKHQLLYPYCVSCAEQLTGIWTKHPLYSIKLDARMKDLATSQRASANVRGVVWAIDKDYILGLFIEQQGRCALTGQIMDVQKVGSLTPGMRNNKTPSIDRIDSSCGYIPGNVQLVCAVVNIMKNDLPQAEFIRLCGKVVDHQIHKQTELLAAIEGVEEPEENT